MCYIVPIIKDTKENELEVQDTTNISVTLKWTKNFQENCHLTYTYGCESGMYTTVFL